MQAGDEGKKKKDPNKKTHPPLNTKAFPKK